METEDQSKIPADPLPQAGPGEPSPDATFTDSILGAMLGFGRSQAGGAWQPPSPEELQRDFPLYEIRGILGRGGMGAVYKGWQKSLGRLVAIKILPHGLDDGISGFTERFKREARAMAQFKHPGIVAVYDAGETGSGLLYFIMECVEGTDVHRLVSEKGRLDPAEALRITTAVCDALGYAHEHGIVHRDIKPSNVMLDADGTVKVADFGLAKSTSPETTQLTMSSVTMGTPDFMAPESHYGAAQVDHRADLYAVGVMLYQMLTGRLPKGRFDPPSCIVPGLDKRLDAIVDKALRNDREQRYSTAIELRTTIEPVLARIGGTRPPGAFQTAGGHAPPWKRTLPISLTATALLVIGLITFYPSDNVESEPVTPARAGADENGTGGAPSSGTLLPDDAPAGAPGGHFPPTPGTATKDAPFVNTLGMKFVPVPGTDVLFSIWHTRVRDYAAYAAVTGSVDGSWKTQQKDGVPVGREADHPVVGVSWEDAQAFCAWLTAKETAAGTLPRGAKYRLPTDAEWSTAVGLPAEPGATPEEKSGKNDVDFPWGREWPPKGRAGNYADETFHAKFPPKQTGTDRRMQDGTRLHGYTDGYATTSPVGSFPANALGLYDMGGNAREWCEDWWNAEQKDRVLRGASWINYDRGYLLSSGRIRPAAGGRGGSYGFRCVLSAVSAQPPSDSAALSPSPQFPPGRWTKVFTNPEDIPAEIPKKDVLNWREGWIDGTSPNGTGLLNIPGTRGRNQGIRLHGKVVERIEDPEVQFPQVCNVWGRRMTNPPNATYRLSFSNAGRNVSVVHYEEAVKKWDTLESIRPETPLKPGDEFDMELIVIGGKLHGKFNGKPLPVVTDARLTEGEMGFQTRHLVRDIEIINLDGLSEAEARKAAGLAE